jgi:transcriptional regulator with XRE-family HTH domain
MNKKIDAAIGNRIRAFRVSSGHTTHAMASAVEMPLNEYTRGEQGERRFSAAELFAFSQVLGIGLVDIVSALDF